MPDFPTRQELFQRARSAALAVPGTRISAKEIDRPGSDLNLLMTAISLVGEEILNRAAKELAGCFEATARGSALDRRIFDTKGLPRLPSAPATLPLSLQRPNAAAGAGTIQGGLPGSTPSPTRIQTNTGVVYVITQNVVFLAGDVGPHLVTGQAELAGLASEVTQGQKWSFIDPPFDTTITITNANVDAAFAADSEDDDKYKARSRSFFPSLRRGTLGAILTGIKSVPGVDSASVIENTAPLTGFPASSVQAFVLDALGQANDTLALRAAVTLLEFRGAGIPVFMLPGVPQYENVVFEGLAFDSTIQNDTNAGVNAVKASIVAALNNQLPGQTLYRSTILAAARQIAGAIVPEGSLITPAADLVPGNPNLAFRTRFELISIDM